PTSVTWQPIDEPALAIFRHGLATALFRFRTAAASRLHKCSENCPTAQLALASDRVFLMDGPGK
ncbi:MAG: hypothetical protein AAGE83_17285, partial [Pseudomonadota bacterium]